MNRREFLVKSGVATAAAALAGCRADSVQAGLGRAVVPGDWASVRAQFDLDFSYSHFAAFVLAAHPLPVREAIATHRAGLDSNTHHYQGENQAPLEHEVLVAGADYLETTPDQIATTDSTTMGLGLVYGALHIRPDQEVLTTEHDFYATHEALRLREVRSGLNWRKVPLYKDLGTVTVDEIAGRVKKAIRRATRLLCVTWVHSSTGLKLPIRAIADTIAEINAGRDPRDQVLLAVDGVHGLGVEPDSPGSLGCDFLIAGTHKWLFGPRGTGIVWGSKRGWKAARPVIPTFDGRSYIAWLQGEPPRDLPPAAAMTPGGFHSFDHRWALADAFRWHIEIGKSAIAERTKALARRFKEGLAEMGHITLVTPMSEELSAGIVCFDVAGQDPFDLVGRLDAEHKVIASVSPYRDAHVRFGPSIATNEAEVDGALEALASFA